MNEKRPRLFTLRQKLSNIPEQSMIRHNRKNAQAYDNRFRPNYDVTTSRLNTAIKTSKQLIILVTNRRQ